MQPAIICLQTGIPNTFPSKYLGRERIENYFHVKTKQTKTLNPSGAYYHTFEAGLV